MQARQKVIVSLDVDHFDQASYLIDILSPKVDYFKIGIAPFTLFGDKIILKLVELKKNIFLDLKFHDIPNTVKLAARAAAMKGVSMMNFHCLGGGRMLKEAVDEVRSVSGSEKPLLIGVTILTSMNAEEMSELGMAGNVREEVLRLAKLAKEAGLDGVVASAQEARMIKQEIGEDFLVVTPGVRPLWSLSAKEDQKRVLTPKQAVLEGADFLVIGRPIIKSDDPLEAANRVILELEEIVVE